jgi:hypothetical protein
MLIGKIEENKIENDSKMDRIMEMQSAIYEMMLARKN